ELGGLLGLLNQGQQVLNIVGYLVLAIAALTLFLSMYSAVLARQQAIAIMRGLGSSRLSVFRVILFETLLVSLIGALLGRILGYGLALIIANVFSAQSAIPVPIRFLPEVEIVLWVVSIGVGALAGIIPAWMAYRVDVVEKLFPS
ncbi:MAG: FtsX-like permease family protein, partial [Chloroflexi bacterium]|nr:FtsX-like permease family protein [Chloroflexota bacterium]